MLIASFLQNVGCAVIDTALQTSQQIAVRQSWNVVDVQALHRVCNHVHYF